MSCSGSCVSAGFWSVSFCSVFFCSSSGASSSREPGSSACSLFSAAEFWVLSLPSVLVSPDFSTSEVFSPDFSASEVFSSSAFRLSVAVGLVLSPVMMMSFVPSPLSLTFLPPTVMLV